MPSPGVLVLAPRFVASLRGTRFSLAATLLPTRCSFIATGPRRTSSSSRNVTRREAEIPQQQQPPQPQQQQQQQQQQQVVTEIVTENKGVVSDRYADVRLSSLRSMLHRAGNTEVDGAGELPRFSAPPGQTVAADFTSFLFGELFIMKGPIRPSRLEGTLLSTTEDDGATWSLRPLGERYRDSYFCPHDAEGKRVHLSGTEVDSLFTNFIDKAEGVLQEPVFHRAWAREIRFMAKRQRTTHHYEYAGVSLPGVLAATEPLLARAGPKSSDLKWRKTKIKKTKWKRRRKEERRQRLAGGGMKKKK